MSFPQDQYGIPLPVFPGWRPINWETEPCQSSDKWVWINGEPPQHPWKADPTSSENPTVGFNFVIAPIKVWGASSGKEWAIYRRIGEHEAKAGWLKLGNTQIIEVGDVIVWHGHHPDESIDAGYSIEGSFVLASKTGYGSGQYCPLIIKRDYIAGLEGVYRRIEGKTKRPMKLNRIFSTPLPLP